MKNFVVSGSFSKVPPGQAVGVTDWSRWRLLQPLHFHLVEGAADPVAEDAAENMGEDVTEDEVEEMA